MIGSNPDNGSERTQFEPPARPLVTVALVSLWVLVLSVPMWGGAFIAAQYNDQYIAGYAFREWAAHQTRALGHIPLWNPELYGGLPFVAAMHGDIFYPTALLRLLLPTDVGMNLGFVLHYLLVAIFTYWFLRTMRVGWAGAVTGALAYQLSGVIGSYVSPGHDGKLFVTALLPLALVALVWAIRDRRVEGYALLALATGLALLTPHPQMVQYFLTAAGIFALYLATTGSPGKGIRDVAGPLAVALAAIVVGVGISAVQYFPFYAYIPYSPRDEAVVANYAFSTSYAIPWAHVPELFLQRFSGESFNRSYWGPNGIKLHSEYLGLAVLGLAVLGGASRERRKLTWWLLGIAGLFLLIGLGSSTPFYRIWWSLVPFVKSTRAPGMALFVVSFVVAVLAAFGVDRLERKEGNQHVMTWMVVGAAIILMGAAGVVSAIAETLAPQGRGPVVSQGAASIRLGAVVSGAALLSVGVLAWAWFREKLPRAALVLGVLALVGTDLWWNAKVFWNYSRAPEEVYGADPIKDFLNEQERPLRVYNLAYPGAVLMADGISQLYGHHGNELHTFDVLHGRDGINLSFQNEGHPNLLDLYAINHIIVPSGAVSGTVPGYRRVLENVTVSTGSPADLFERVDPIPYARLIPAAVKAPMEQTVQSILNPRFPISQVVVLPEDGGIDPPPVSDPLPEPSPTRVTVTDWAPGRMVLRLEGEVPSDGYVLVSENHYKNWRAEVDGREAPVVRGNGALITVPVPAGTEELLLRYVSPEYRTGRMVTLGSLGIVVLGLLVPPVLRRRSGG